MLYLPLMLLGHQQSHSPRSFCPGSSSLSLSSFLSSSWLSLLSLFFLPCHLRGGPPLQLFLKFHPLLKWLPLPVSHSLLCRVSTSSVGLPVAHRYLPGMYLLHPRVLYDSTSAQLDLCILELQAPNQWFLNLWAAIPLGGSHIKYFHYDL